MLSDPVCDTQSQAHWFPLKTYIFKNSKYIVLFLKQLAIVSLSECFSNRREKCSLGLFGLVLKAQPLIHLTMNGTATQYEAL